PRGEHAGPGRVRSPLARPPAGAGAGPCGASGPRPAPASWPPRGPAARRRRAFGRRVRPPGSGGSPLIVSSRVGRLLAAVVRASIWRPWATVLLSGLLALMAGLYTFRSLDFITSSLRLLPQRARYVMLLSEYLNDFSDM